MAQTANPAPAALHKFRYAPLELVSRREVIPATEHTLPVTLYRFRLPDGHRSGLATGHHLVVAAEVNGSYETRKYTPVSAPGAVGELDLLVKVYPDGVMSRHIDSLPIGASLDMKGPAGYFKYPRGGLPGISHLAMVGGGTGITPLISVLRELVNCPDDATKATLLYANRTEADILLRDELDRISQDKRVEVVHTLTRDPAWTGRHGRPTEEAMREVLPAPGEGVKVLLCGSKDMNVRLKKAALAIGHSEMALVIF